MTQTTASTALQEARQYQEKNQWQKAQQVYEKILKKTPHHPEAMSGYGFLLHQQGRSAQGLPWLEKAFQLQNDHSNIAFNYGVVAAFLRQYAKAETAFQKVLEKKSKDELVWYYLAVCQDKQGAYPAAENSIEKAITLNPSAWKYYLFQAKLAAKMEHREQALSLFERVTMMAPNDETFSAAATFFKAILLYPEALRCVERALKYNPRSLTLCLQRIELAQLRRDLEATDRFIHQALEHHPKESKLRALRCRHQQDVANWHEKETEELWLHDYLNLQLQNNENPTITSFLSFSFAWPDVLRKKIAEQKAKLNEQAFFPTERPLIFKHSKQPKQKLRIAYISPDFRNHATGHLLGDSLHHHDRSRFEIFAYGYGARDKSGIQEAVAGSVDHWHFFEPGTVEEWAKRIHADQIDILIDMVGLLVGGKTELYALKPAPIQMGYMAYPGTSGIKGMDYYIADAFALPLGEEAAWTEQIIRLPDTYWLRSDTEVVAPLTWTRIDEGLPEKAFVLAAFNTIYKIEPQIFSVWMNILKALPKAVLWLLSESSLVQENLRKEAEAQGVAAERLIFAKVRSKAEHLARHALADLALDTYIVNGHTTTSDALYLGLPVITCPGNTFVSRVAGSLLQAADLNECVLDSLQAYEDKAIALAQKPAELKRLKKKLQAAHKTAPLFNTRLRIAQLEEVYQTVWEKYLQS